MKQFASIAVLISLLIAGIKAEAIEVGDQLALGELRSVQGQTYTESHWKQRHTVVQVWATWCSYCRKQNVHLEQLVQKVPANQLNIITISIDKNPKLAKDYMSKHGYTFPAAMMTPELNQSLGKVKGIPILLILDKNNKIIHKEMGEMFEEDFADLKRFAK